jgi:YesN/AraC family two-component response regulator
MMENLRPHYEPLYARNGVQALKTMRRQHIDLIVLDVKMPELDGFGVVRAMHNDKSLRHIPVIVYSGQAISEADMRSLTDYGVFAVMPKGVFTTRETLAHIDMALQNVGRARLETARLVRQAMAYMQAHLAESLTREQLASHVAVSADHLNRCFQQELGLSVMTYLTRCRISEAKKLLTTTRHSIRDVAGLIGFPNLAYFCRVFRREVGISPGAYRQQA